MKPGGKIIRLRLEAGAVNGRIDERVYGHFLEHIFHSVNGGLWGEMVWDRSFEDPPVADPGVAGGWQPFGRGRFERSGERPLNSGRCQRVVAGRGECGVRQSPLCVERGRIYRGSLYVRGEARALAVRLVDARGAVLARCALGGAGPAWRRRPFVLRPRRDAPDAALEIAVAAGGAVWLDQVSLMSDAARRCGGFRPDLLAAIAALKPPMIRYPGGSFTCWYRWKDGVGPQHARRVYPMRIWDDQDVNSFGTDEFMALCRRVGAEPVLCVNIAPFDPHLRPERVQEAREWVEYCNGSARSRWGRVRAANGHREPYGVKYWEIGNEPWNLKPADYARAVREFAGAMRAADPSIRIISAGSGELGRTWPQGDAALLRGAADAVDYHSLHHYAPAEEFATGPRKAERFYRRFARRIARSRNPSLKLYISEWNAMSTDWRTGLYCGGMLNVLERCSEIAPMACPALWLRHVSASGWDNAFINFDHKAWFAAPNYVVMKLWRDHYAPDRLAVRGRAAPLDVVAARSADGRSLCLKAVNASDQPRNVEVSVSEAFPVARAALTKVAPGGLVMRNMLGDPGRVRATPGHVRVEGQRLLFELPRYAVAVVKAEKKAEGLGRKKKRSER